MSCPIKRTTDPFESEWFVPTDLQAGDIFQTPSKIPRNSPICPGMLVDIVKHVGILVEVNGTLAVAHNPFGQYPIIEDFDSAFSDRKIEKIIRTGTPSEQIIERISQIKDHRYSFWDFNCEDAVRFICGCSMNNHYTDQRRVYSFIILALVIIILLLLIFKK